MGEISVKDMTQYLHMAVELETSVYRQERAKKKANNDLQYERPKIKKERVKEPVINIEDIPKPKEPKEEEKTDIFMGTIVFSILGVAAIIGGIVLLTENMLLFAVGLMAVGAGMLFVGKTGYELYKEQKEKLEAYPAIKQEYDEKVKQEQDKYEQELIEYNLKIQEAEEKYEKDLVDSQNNYELAKQEIQKLDAPISQTKETLQQLYDIGWIFPKYRNMIAMCTIYEYFASGRCTELTGANGAYNLYESELRQNLIIGRLDMVIQELEQIQQNQYTLYSELKKTNKILGEISDDIKGILQSTKNIEEYSHITTLCSYATAKNTEALKYISLING